MLCIKLRPIGKKKQISYRVVVLPKRSKLTGKFIEDLGWYNPHTDKFQINPERAKHWVAQGAQPTASVHNLLVTAKLIEGPKIPLHKKSKQPEKPQAPASESPAVEASSPEAAPAASE